MASNTAPPFRVEFRDVQDLQGVALASKTASRPAAVRPAPAGIARSRITAPAVYAEGGAQSIPPFAALAAKLGRPLRIAILSDFTRIPYANGAVFQTRFLYQELRRCGHEVTVIGPHDPDASPDELAPGTISLPSLPLKTYPGVYLPVPLAAWVGDVDRWNFDLCFAQTTSLLMEFGVWLRKMKGIPLLCVNTTHLAAAYEVMLPEKLAKIGAVHWGLARMLQRPFEQLFAGIYNESDGLIVLSEGLRDYWRARGVTAPIHVVPRAVQPEVFDAPLGPDPYVHLLGDRRLASSPRLVCAGRHTREKSQDRVIRIFAEHVLPYEPDATLTLIGDGPDSSYYRRVAKDLGVDHRVFFTGEVPFTKMPDCYAYADIFVHASLSETYGNVLGEALWCGTPTVAFADGMGVSSQVQHEVSGIVIDPGKGVAAQASADAAFGRAVVSLIRSPTQRGRLGQAAARMARERAAPRVVQQKLADAFESACANVMTAGLHPVAGRGRLRRWATTFKHFRPWTTVMGGVYLFGYLRPSPTKNRATLHPQIGQ